MNLINLNKKRWDNCHVLAARGSTFEHAANRIKANKAVYVDIEKATGVPWWFIGVVHLRESDLNMATNIANGQRYDRKTTIVPKGRGPFNSFKEAAIDALVNCAPYAAKNKDWSAAGALSKLEEYNGLGYAARGLPSPYIWAGTDQYTKGKFVADHVFDPEVVDTQLGCAGVLKFLGVFNKSGGLATAGAAVGGGLLYTFWHGFSEHWIAYTAGLLLTSFIIDCVIYWYRNRKTTNV